MNRGRTFDALIARGIDSAMAEELVVNGHTIAELKQMVVSTLMGLGLTREAADVIHNGSRPPIPTNVVNRLLRDSRSTCCVCRTPRRPIIIHHIEPWNESRSHDEPNLVVVCLICHDEAHTKHELSINLTPERLRVFKSEWISEVNRETAAALMAPHAHKVQGPMWDYFNHNRIIDLAHQLSINVDAGSLYTSLLQEGSIARSGEPRWHPDRVPRSESRYMYDGLGWHDRRLYRFYADLASRVLLRTRIIDLSSDWSPKTFKSLVTPGTVVGFAGGWRFKKLDQSIIHGPGQNRKAYVQKRKLRLEFSFDCWETTSGSASSNLSGSWPCTGIAIVRQIDRRKGLTLYAASGLAIGTGFAMPYRTVPLPEGDKTDGGDEPDCEA